MINSTLRHLVRFAFMNLETNSSKRPMMHQERLSSTHMYHFLPHTYTLLSRIMYLIL
jgi:hypothetical protein